MIYKVKTTKNINVNNILIVDYGYKEEDLTKPIVKPDLDPKDYYTIEVSRVDNSSNGVHQIKVYDDGFMEDDIYVK